MKSYHLAFFFFFTLNILAVAQPQPQELPLFLADLPTPSAFSLFANGGWDGNWYVGNNTCWIQKISVPQKGHYKRAFVGAKLGRAKTVPTNSEKSWIKKNIPGEIFVALSSTYSWKQSQPISLVLAQEIPLEADAAVALDGAGEARWFWKEIPLDSIQFGADNFIALWSASEQFKSAQTSPILAGGWGNSEINSWMVQDTSGAPPNRYKPKLWKPITVFQPAIALKLIPEQTPLPPIVRIAKIDEETESGKLVSKVLWCSVEGESVSRAWTEISTDGKSYQRVGKVLWESPYAFRINMAEVPLGPEGKSWVRIEAVDFFENAGVSDAVNIFERR